MSKKLIGLTLALALFAVALPVSASNLTQPQIQAIIGILQSFGAEQSVINSVYVSLGGGTSSNTGSGSSCIELSYNLFSGSTDGTSGGQVTRLQRFLGVSQTGYFGPETEAAVQRWQSSHSIVSSGSPDSTGYGYVGPRTRAAMAQGCDGQTTTTADIIIEEEMCGLGANVCPITITWFANNVQKAVLQGAGPLWPTSENIDGPNTDLFGTKKVELPSGEHTFSVSGFNGTSWGNPLKTVVYRRMKSIPPTTELSVTPANKCKIAVGATTCRVTMTWSTNGYYHSVLQGVGPLWPSAANIDGPVPSAPYLDRTASFDLPAGAHIFSVSVFNGSSWGTPKNVTNYIVEAS